MNLIAILNEDTSRVHKENELAKANNMEQRVLRFAYDPDIKFGVKFTDSEIDLDNLGEPNHELFELLPRLSHRELTGNAARIATNTFADKYGDLIKLICNKDLQCGVSATTINKVFPGLIPVFKVQLAKEVPLSELTYPMHAQLKYDGVRIVILWDGVRAQFRTRNGKFIVLPEIANYLTRVFVEYPAVMLDSEVTLRNGKTEDRTTVSGMINSARSGNSINESMLVFNVFDAMPLAQFNSGECSLRYSCRLAMAEDACTLADLYLAKAESKLVTSANQAQEVFYDALANGDEGIILKPINHKYTFKRSKDWVKLKDIRTADLLCTGTIEGTGKYQNMLGALVCEGIVDGKKVNVNVGSGLTDADRMVELDAYVGQTIEVKYNSVILDTVRNTYSLFLPRFVMVRFDK